MNEEEKYHDAFCSHLDEALEIFRRTPEKGYAELKKEGRAILSAAGWDVTAVVISPRYDALKTAATDFEAGAL